MEGYDLPFYQKSSMKWYYNLFFITYSILLIVITIFMIEDEELCIELKWIIGSIMVSISLLMMYVVLMISILKKSYIRISDEYIEVKDLWKERKVYWNDIVLICESDDNNASTIGILLKKDLEKKMKRSISKSYRDITGESPISFKINIKYFHDIDRSKLFITIKRKIDTLEKYEWISNEVEEENSWIKAIVCSFLAFIVVVIIYLFILWSMDRNSFMLSIFSSYMIVSVFNKYYIEKNINLKARLYLGFLCFLQVPVAIITYTLIKSNLEPNFLNIIGVIIGYYQAMIGDMKNSILLLLSMIGCFFIGAFVGRVKK